MIASIVQISVGGIIMLRDTSASGEPEDLIEPLNGENWIVKYPYKWWFVLLMGVMVCNKCREKRSAHGREERNLLLSF